MRPTFAGTMGAFDVLVEARVYSSEEKAQVGGRPRYDTDFTVTFAPIEPQFSLARQGVGSALKKKFGAQDIVIGDAEFDKAFVIKGTDEVAIGLLFTTERRRLLLDLHEEDNWLEASNTRLYTGTSTVFESHEKFVDTINGLLTAAQALGAGARP
ncbi:MAG: hypothetical protein ACI91O_000710 [Candidatus Poriferisodalaceae bacterium]|jgi:hypothetical protein